MHISCGFGAPARARKLAVGGLVSGEPRDIVELLVSELVTNAVLHAHTEIELTVRDLGDCIRVEVSDDSPRLPELHPAGLTESGRGLQIVDALASRWGTEGRTGGKTVWFEVTTTADAEVSTAR